ncbi:hypothetical protein MMC18_003357 [Xylographa bjoerkii]|nr:hypothetical protein [Xylographa bjoerkii]
MQLQLLALLAALGAASASFTVPTGQTDGVYSVYTDASGQEIYTRLDAVKPRSAKFGPASPATSGRSPGIHDLQQ